MKFGNDVNYSHFLKTINVAKSNVFIDQSVDSVLNPQLGLVFVNFSYKSPVKHSIKQRKNFVICAAIKASLGKETSSL